MLKTTIDEDSPCTGELLRRIAVLEGTAYAHGTLIKALDDHCQLMTRMLEVLSKQNVELKKQAWSNAN